MLSSLSLLPIIISLNESSSFFYDFYTAQFILYWEKDILVFYTFLLVSINKVYKIWKEMLIFLFVIAWLCYCRPSVEWWADAGASGPQRGTRWSCCSSRRGTAVVLKQANNMGTKKRIVFKTKINTRVGSVLLQANKMRTKESITSSQAKNITRTHRKKRFASFPSSAGMSLPNSLWAGIMTS